jgi:outer membrane protein OmpA-like peptidoglycan-associated protein
VIDEARVQDVPLDGEDGHEGDEAEQVGEGKDSASPAPAHLAEVPVDEDAAAPNPDVHPMWDEPATEKRNVLAVWRHRADELPPMRLNMPVRVTVRHDDLQVHDITLSFPAALLKRALGMHVDPLEMSLSEVQSAFIAPVGAGFTSYELASPELAVVPPPAEPEPRMSEEDEPPRRRRRLLAPALVVLLALLAAGGWWVVQGRDSNVTAGTPTTSTSAQPTQQPTASTSPSAEATSTTQPKVTHARPSDAPTREPNVVLTSSQLAFDKNSAVLSSQAKSLIDTTADEVRSRGLTGKIFVKGYTDNLGSAASGIRLSRQRAQAVSEYLGSQLVGVPVTIVVVANGEKDPIASNKTEAGREKNRRVTITLPKS